MPMWISDPERYVPDRLWYAGAVIGNCHKRESGCFEWGGSATSKGYGRIKIKKRLFLTHRVVAYAAGLLDTLEHSRNKCILHKCDNPRCCNPDHLEVGSMAENMRQCVARGRHPSQQLAG